jgi:YqjK-like protein
MSQRYDQLNAHHSNLLARIAVQRQQLGETADEIEHELGRIDRGLAAVRRVLRSPVLICGAIGVVALIGPRRLARWSTKGLMLYSTARQLLRFRRESYEATQSHDGG